MDTKTLIHVGIETVVIGGITFYFKRKIDTLEGEIQLLREQNIKLQQNLDTLARVLEQHDRYLRGEPVNTQPRVVQPHSTTSTQAQSTQSSHYPPQPPPRKDPPSADNSRVVIEEEPDEEELDGLLEDELSNLKKESPEFIEIECSGDFCEVSIEPSKKKALRPKRKKVKNV